MRCFLAVELNEEARKELFRVQSKIFAKGLKFVNPDNLHLTLKFFGEIDDRKISMIKKQLSDFKLDKIKCHLGEVGFFPSPSYVRVVWVSLEPQEKIKELSKKINEKIKSKDERFESHITLARVRFLKNKKEFAERIKNIEVKPVEVTLDSLCLKKSTLTKKGPVYETLKKFTF